MFIFSMFGGGGSNAFKNKVKAINDNETLSDTEKMEAIDLLLNPIVVDSDFGITFQGTRLSFQGDTINYMGVN